ncbi:hypothetical protein PENSPDRAFT_18548 [Peniophora sp. CONT]|nr:hypothetical protein PENSPDRAFT_18548 [Peniophora sp. CONT]
MRDEDIAMSDEESTTSDSDSEESAMFDYQSAMSDKGNDTPGPIFGPQIARAERPPPPRKRIRLRIDLDGLRGLPQTNTSSKGSDAQPSHSVKLSCTSRNGHFSFVGSSPVWEGVKALRGTVRWNDILYLGCFELSFIQI